MNKTVKGFTLIELLVALLVFAILATITSMAMVNAFNTRDRLKIASDRLNELQLAMTIMQRGTAQMVNRAVRGNDMRIFPAFVGQKDYMEFTQGGFINPDNMEQRSTLKRQALLCNEEQQLVLRSWLVLDSLNRKEYTDRILLSKLEACKFAYLDYTLNLLDEWRPNAVQQNQLVQLPKAVQLTLKVPGFGKAQLLFPVNGGLRVHR